MRIGIITFHFVNNFGGALQAYALQQTIRKSAEAEVKIIDYRNRFIQFTDMVRLFPITTNFKEIVSGLKTLKERLGRKKKFAAFVNDYCQMTERRNKTQISRENEMDVLVCGSDQIWNPTITLGLDKNYFLGFKTEAKKVAYAPSVGIERLSNKKKSLIGKYLDDFDALSVREDSSVDIIETLAGKKVEQLIDPTFLIDIKVWDDIAISPDIKQSYILLYIMQRNEEVYNYARRMKEKYNMPIVEISRYGYKPDFIDYTLIDIGPAEFVGLFKHATYICTNSYHGLAFSMIYGKEICLIPSRKYGIRMNSLMRLLQIKQSDCEDELLLQYDCECVNNIIKREREKSIKYLRDNLM